jgi:hypothetical protein
MNFKSFLTFLLLSITFYCNAQLQINNGVSPAKKCPLDTLTLSVTSSTGLSNFEWFDVAEPSIVLSTTTSLDIYTLPNIFGISIRCRALDSGNNTILSNIVFVEYQDYAKINLGNDTSLCAGDSIILKNKSTANPAFLTYEYLWNYNNITNPEIKIGSTGSYILFIKGPLETTVCVNSDTINVTYTPGVVFNAGIDTLICFGDSIQLNPVEINAGVTPYFYTWDNTSSLSNGNIANPIAKPTTTTTYSLNVKDSGGTGGCESNSTITVSVNPQLSLNTSFSDSIVCKFTSVNFNVDPNGGTPFSSGYQYLWQINGNGSLNDNTIQNPTASINALTNFICIVTDSIGCTATNTINLTPTSLQASISLDTLAFCLNDIITLDVNVQGGVGNYTNSWAGTGTFSSPNSLNTNLITSTSAYAIFSVTDENNCTDKDSVYVKINLLPNVNISSTVDSICQGNTLAISANANSGSGSNYQFNWSPNLQSSISGNTSTLSYSTFANTIQTIYISVIDANNCNSNTDSVKIKPLFAPYVNLGSADTAICDSVKLALTFNNAFTYLWRDTTTGIILGNGANVTVSELSTYQVIVTSSNGCQNTDYITLTRIPNLVLTSLIVSDSVITTDGKANFTVNSNATNFLWTTTGTGTLENTTNPTNSYTPSNSDSGLITFNLKASNACTSIDTIVRIRINQLNKIKNIFIPNVFSPNASLPENRVLRVFGNNVEDTGFDFKVFNRWGTIVYESNSFADANTRGWAADNAQDGVYTYVIKGKFTDGTEFAKPGTVTLLK